MTAAARLSVVVVSAGRPRALARCLTGLFQMRTIRAEVIVVACADGLAVARALPFANRLTLLPQTAENISAARNAGWAVAAGDVVAFIDDDAVPEPGWAEALLAGFADPSIAAVTGPVIGRNGISLQWGRMAVDALGHDRWLDHAAQPTKDEALKLHGTNMAIRRDVSTQTGGFDTGFAFYLDETDLTLRLAGAGFGLAYLPGAVVHHGFAASRRRNADRIPLDLFDIGASSALFLRKHAPDDIDEALSRLESDQRARLMRLARQRKIGPDQMRRLLESLRAGIADGRMRASDEAKLPEPSRGFLPIRLDLPPPIQREDGGWLSFSRLRAEAALAVAAGQPVALMLLAPTFRKHRVEFTQGGWWEQRGGLFGPSDRTGARVQLWRYHDRVVAEWARRNID